MLWCAQTSGWPRRRRRETRAQYHEQCFPHSLVDARPLVIVHWAVKRVDSLSLSQHCCSSAKNKSHNYTNCCTFRHDSTLISCCSHPRTSQPQPIDRPAACHGYVFITLFIEKYRKNGMKIDGNINYTCDDIDERQRSDGRVWVMLSHVHMSSTCTRCSMKLRNDKIHNA